MFLISLANSLPRLASIAAFLCLVVAHLEWPLTDLLRGGGTGAGATGDSPRPADRGRVPHDLHEERVDPGVPGQLGVEAGGHDVALAHRDDPTVGRSTLDPPEDLHPGPR